MLTTGQPIRITSRTSARKPAHYYELQIDTNPNRPEVLKDEQVEWEGVKHGTRVEIELEARYQRPLQQQAVSQSQGSRITCSATGPIARYLIGRRFGLEQRRPLRSKQSPLILNPGKVLVRMDSSMKAT